MNTLTLDNTRKTTITPIQWGLAAILLNLLCMILLNGTASQQQFKNILPSLTDLSYFTPYEKLDLAWLYIQLAFIICLLAPAVEELVFRVALQGKICRNSTWGIVAVSILFALAHGWPLVWLTLLPFGFLFGVAYKYGGFKASFTAHAMSNGFALAVLTLTALLC